MSRHLARTTSLVAAALIMSLTTAAAGAAVASGRVAAAPPGAAPAAGAALTDPITLVDGDRVVAGSPGAGPGAAVVLAAPGTGPASSVAKVLIGGRGFVIPLAVMPYLGRGLDLSLFDVASLQHAERGGRIPVTLRYQGQRPTVPGIIVTQVRQGTAEGYLTPASAARFGAALTRQAAAGHGSGGLFAGHLSIALAGTAAPGARAAAPAPTITVTGTDLDGKPDTGGTVLVGDVDNSNLPANGLTAFKNGTATFTGVPGTYWALAVFFQLSATGKILAVRMDVLPQFTVTGNTTVHLSARVASSKITLVTPRPAIAQSTTLTLVRAAPHAPANGQSPLVNSFGFSSLAAPLWVSPVSRPPGHGTLRVFTSGQLTSPPGQGVPYAYTLNFADPPGTIPPQHFTASPANLATVSESYTQDLPSAGYWQTLGGTPYQVDTSFVGAFDLALKLPARQVQYISASPPMLWFSLYGAYRTISAGQPPGGQTSASRLLHAGQRLTQNWGQYPLHPGPDYSFPDTPDIPVLPSAYRVGNTLSLDVTPFSDNQPGDVGDGFDVPFPASVNEVSGSYTLDQNGVKIAGGTVPLGPKGFVVSAALSAKPAVVKLTLTASRASSHYKLSATSTDVWTWHSRPEPGATIPVPWFCIGPTKLTRHCAVQPMITLDYQVAGLALDGTASSGHQAVTITASHIQLAPTIPVTHLQVQVSFNGGKTWQQAAVRPAGHDRFGATFTAPGSAQVSLRVTATDGAGDSLAETILQAYQTSA